MIKELSYNSSYENKNEIFRLVTHIPKEDYTQTLTSYQAGPIVLDNIPEIESFTRFSSYNRFDIYYKHDLISSRKYIYAVDQGFREIFSIELIHGDFSELSHPNTIAITKSIAEKHFYNKIPIGELLQLGEKSNQIVKIVAVINDFPKNSTIQAEYLVDFSNIIQNKGTDKINKSDITKWNEHKCYTYLFVNPDFNFSYLEEKITSVINKMTVLNYEFYLQSLNDIHIHKTNYPDYDISLTDKSTINYFILVIILIFIVGMINHIIISIANINQKLKVIGLKKILGSGNFNTRAEYFYDSMFYSFFAIPIALFTIYLISPVISELFSIDLFIIPHQTPAAIIFGLIIFILLSIISGFLVSTYVINKSPVKYVREELLGRSNKAARVRYLSLIQLVIFILLTNFVLSIKKQIHYSAKIETGISGENLYVVNPKEINLQKNYQILRNHLLSQPGIELVSSNAMGFPTVEGAISAVNNFQDPTIEVIAHHFLVDYDFLKTVGIKIIEGRYFKDNITGSDKNSIIVNEKAIRQLGIKNPISSHIGESRIIGVVEDFNLYPLDRDIPPLIIHLNTKYHSLVYIKLKDGFESSVISETIRNQFPDQTFEVIPYSEHNNKFYYKEIDFAQAVSFITIVALLICIVGLIGISWFAANVLKYEIAIRKVFGASIFDIFNQNISKFFFLVIVANIIAIPFSFLIIRDWLSKYVFQTPITVTLFVTSFIISFLIVVGTISLNVLNAARCKPIDLLRDE